MVLKKKPKKDQAVWALIHETYSILRDHNANDAETILLRKVIQLRYPDWTRAQIDTFLDDIPNIDILANQIVYRESGLFKAGKRRNPADSPSTVRKTELREEKIGHVLHYYPHLAVAVIELEKGAIREGDVVHLKGPGSDLMQEVGLMESDNQFLIEARSGQTIGLRIEGKVQEHDAVYKVRNRRGSAAGPPP